MLLKLAAALTEPNPPSVIVEMSDWESDGWEGVTVELKGCHDQHSSPSSPPPPGFNTQFISMFPSQRLRCGEQN